jgi:hypothetical protein
MAYSIKHYVFQKISRLDTAHIKLIWDGSVGIVTGCRLDDRGGSEFESQ